MTIATARAGEKRKRSRQKTAVLCCLTGSALLYYLNGPPSFESSSSYNTSSKGATSAARSLRNNDSYSGDNQHSRKPNILFLLLDQWRYDWDGHHTMPDGQEIPLRVPFLTHLGQTGTRFTQTYVPSPYCAPSRACVASGMELDAIGVRSNNADTYPIDRTTFYRLLRDDAGYHTMTCGKDDLYKSDERFPYYERKTASPMDLGFSDAIRSAGKVRTARDPPSGVRADWFDEPYRNFLNAKTVTLRNGTEINARTAYVACLKGWGVEAGCDPSSFTEEIYPDNFVRDRAWELLERKPKDQPWFLQVNFPGPHHPHVATSKMALSVMDREWPMPFDNDGHLVTTRGGKFTMPCPQQQPDVTEKFPLQEHVDGSLLRLHDMSSEQRRTAEASIDPPLDGRCNYAAEIENIDMLLQSIVDRVEEMGELDNTLIVVAGDHGDVLADHGSFGKGQPWQSAVSVPLFVSGPGIPQQAVYKSPVTTLDLGGTFLDYAGVEQLAPGMTTSSLRPILEASSSEVTDNAEESTSPTSPRPYISSGYGEWRMVVKEMPTSPQDPTLTSYKLICCKAGLCFGAPKTATPYVEGEPWHIMLYDAVRDPFDMEPLDQTRPDVVAELVPLLPEGWCR